MKRLAVTLVLAAAACAAPHAPVFPVHIDSLAGTDGAMHDLTATAADATLTVFVFFAPGCGCLKMHEPRLAAMAERLRPSGVRFFMVDSEAGATAARDADEARRRAYPFPLLTDVGAELANALGADYATYAVVVDRDGRVRYHGGLDSDRTTLHDDATLYLSDAIDDLLAGREPRVASTRVLGCTLTKW
jgi:hypothetical protein